MGKSNNIRARSKVIIVLAKGIFSFFLQMKKYKTLKKGEIASIPNSNLRDVIMYWIWNKIDHADTDQYEVIASLAQPCRNVFACCTIADEVGNGGLNQLFYNSTRQFTKIAQDGFLAIGSEKLYGIMADAICIYEENKELLERYHDGTDENFSASYQEHLFDKLDTEFINEITGFDNLLEVYIRKNQDAFAD